MLPCHRHPLMRLSARSISPISSWSSWWTVRVRTYNQNLTTAASAQAEWKTSGHRSQRAATRRRSLSPAKLFPVTCRFLWSSASWGTGARRFLPEGVRGEISLFFSAFRNQSASQPRPAVRSIRSGRPGSPVTV